MSSKTYKNSPLADQAPKTDEGTGTPETIPSAKNVEYMGGRVPAFLGLAKRTGGTFVEAPKDMATALKQVGLDYEVRLEQAGVEAIDEGMDDAGEPVEIRRFVPSIWMGTVGHYNDGRDPVPFGLWMSKKYGIVQNQEGLDWGSALVQASQGDAQLVALGAYGEPEGAKTYAAFNLPEGFFIGGDEATGDRHDLYLTILNSHDGMGGLGAWAAPVRFDCTNQTTAVFDRTKAHFAIRHSAGIKVRMEDAVAVLAKSNEYISAYKTNSEILLASKMDEGDFIKWERQMFDVPADAAKWSTALTRSAQPREDQLIQILGSDTCGFGAGTAYAAAQAMTEYVDFWAPTRKANGEEQAVREGRIMRLETEGFETTVWKTLLARASKK